MNKKNILVLITSLILILGLYLIQKNKINSESQIDSIHYSFSGTYIGDIYDYYLYENTDGLVLKVIYMGLNEENPYIVRINAETFKKIEKLIEKYDVKKMNGFHESDPDVLDGYSFSMEIKYKNNDNISFSGSNTAPNGYFKFEKEFFSLFENELTEINNRYNLN